LNARFGRPWAVVFGILIMAQNCKAGEFRPSAHAGTWYPGTAQELSADLKKYLGNVRGRLNGDIRGLVAPHAGYVYSGPIAAYAYRAVEGMEFDAVIVIGPSHAYGFAGASIDTMAGRTTPLGTVKYDLALARAIMKADKNIRYEPGAHAAEHSTEIQVPFVQTVLPGCPVLEIVMGDQSLPACRRLADAVFKAAGDRKVLVVASTDLSHYHNQAQAETLDQRVIEAVAAFDPERLAGLLAAESCEACGGGPVVTAMLLAKKLGATAAKPLVYATSGDITGDRSQVVGYLAAAFYVEKPAGDVGVRLGFTDPEKELIRTIARQAIEAAVRGEKPPAVGDLPARLKENYGIFVTIKKHGELRGCIGHIIADQPLYKSCQEMARAAALNDPRFPAVKVRELPDLAIEISVLTPMERLTDPSSIVIGRDGLIIRKGYQSGLLLPQVAAEYGWTAEEFLAQTCRKAGLPQDAYQDQDAEIYKFSAEVF
jgi:AmmeMemoRadiSam system protein B/AmmeMemoRadiSam system protein A